MIAICHECGSKIIDEDLQFCETDFDETTNTVKFVCPTCSNIDILSGIDSALEQLETINTFIH